MGSQGCGGEAKRSAGLKREEGVSYAKCSQEVKSEKFTFTYDSIEVTNDLDQNVSVGPWVGSLAWAGSKRGCEVRRLKQQR